MNLADRLYRLRPRDGRQPDFRRLRRALVDRVAGPVGVGELFVDAAAVGRHYGFRHADFTGAKLRARDIPRALRTIRGQVRYALDHGWDHAFAFSDIGFPDRRVMVNNLGELGIDDGQRGWVDDNHGPVENWDDFERYPWPADLSAANRMARLSGAFQPAGMEVMVIPGGVFEWTTWLMGYVPFCYALADAPELVEAVADRVAGILRRVIEDALSIPGVGGIFMGDDIGHATGTLASPEIIREAFLPRIRPLVDLTHQAGKLFFLHSCGNLTDIMDDIIALGVDAKHSFEDKIMPVEEVARRWGSRVGLIGGLDIDLLTRGPEAAIRRRTREILDACAPGGGYVLGSGNSVAAYIPDAHYDAMVDEGRLWNRERFGQDW